MATSRKTPGARRASPSAAERKFIQQARARFDQAQVAKKEQSQRELDDLRFYAGDQWPADIVKSRAGQSASGGMPAVPARPCLTINKTRAPIRQVLNEERQADFGVEITPADDFGDLADIPDETEITLRQGLIRRIQRHSIASDARTWAFSRAAITGQGFYRINLRYLPGTWDQEVVIERILNQASVTLDPRHEMPDGSDAEYVFIGSDLSWEEYQAEFPGSGDRPNHVLAADSDEAFRALGDEAPNWFVTDDEGDTRSVRVVEYFYTERTTKTVERTKEDGTVETRQDIVKTIKWAKIDGIQILDETEWASPHMPIVKVLGEELHPYDNERRFEGMVRPAIDSARGFNYMVSKQVESVGLAPLPPWMVAEGQIEGYESWYEQANTRTLPYLPYRQRDLEGNPAPPPSRVNAEVQIDAISRSVAMFDNAIQATTMVPDPSLGHQAPSLRSGKAVERLVAQAQRGTSNYLDNLARSMRYEAQIINSLLYPIYGRPGRLTRMMTGQGDQTTPVLIGKPFVMQGANGSQRPQVVPPNAEGAKQYRLSKDAMFNIAIKVTKAYDTRRQEQAQMLGELIAESPNLMTVFGDLWFENMDAPGHAEMAKRAKLMLAEPIQQSLTSKEPIPPALQNQMAKAQQMITDLSKELEAKTDLIEKDTIKAQRDLLMNEQDNAAKVEVAKIQAGATLTVANLKADTQTMIEAAKAQLEQLRMIVEAAEAERLQHGERAHEAIAREHEAHLDRLAAEDDAALERVNATHAAIIDPPEAEATP